MNERGVGMSPVDLLLARFRGDRGAFWRVYERFILNKLVLLAGIVGPRIVKEDYVRIFEESLYCQLGVMTEDEFVELFSERFNLMLVRECELAAA
jgi:hypothetical protein